MSDPYFGGPRPLAARERLVTPKGPLPKSQPKSRVSRTSYPATSGMGALAAKTGGSYAFDRPPQRPDDIKILQHAVKHSPGVRAIAEMTRDPLGLLQAGGAVKNVVKHPGVGTGVAAGISVAGLALPGIRKAKVIEEAPIISAAKKIAKLRPAETKALQVVHEGTPIEKRIAEAKAAAKSGDKTAKKELSSLQAAKKHVHDVNGMPRINPANHKLVDVYAQAEKKLKTEPPTPKEQIRGAMRGARVARGKQEVMYSEERAARVAKASKHLDDSNLAPAERLALAKNELRGELPKINFKGFNELNDESLSALQEHILNHPHLMPFQKIRAAGALEKALSGRVPQKSELDLLQHVFGKETAAGIGQAAHHPLRNTLLGALNIPRSVMASFDLSAPFRQGLVVATRHPVIFAKNFKPMIKSFGSERVYNETIDNIQSRPTYPMMMEAKLAITRLGKEVGGREEQFASDPAERIPIVGRGIRASGRAYTAFLDKTRADVFDHLVGRAQQQGRNVQDEKFLKDLGRYINAATGRGPLPGHFEGAAKALNTFFFSPRLLASRLDLIFSPASYARADPFVRKEALRSMFQLAGTASTLIALASQIPGAKVVTDPRNPDWGKIKIGNTRVDIGGGFQQPLRLFAQLATGEAISSTTGKKLNLTAGGFGQPNRLDIFLRFFEGKESPWASVATDWLRNSNQIGQPFTWKSEAVQHLTPLLAQDTYDLYNDRKGGLNGIAAAFAGYGIGSLGFGLQTYGPKKPKAASGDSYFGGSSAPAGDPYFGSGGPSASDPYFGP